MYSFGSMSVGLSFHFRSITYFLIHLIVHLMFMLFQRDCEIVVKSCGLAVRIIFVQKPITIIKIVLCVFLSLMKMPLYSDSSL